MRLDGMRRHGDDEVVDAVVIGTGAGGGPLLARLAARGLRVVALEAGRNWQPAEFVHDEALSDIYWTGERLSGGADPEAFGANNSGRGLGGSLLHWGAFVPRADPRDLRLGTELGGEAARPLDWPLDPAELTPYYEAVERTIGVSGPAPYPWDPQRRYLLPPVARNAPAEAMARGCAALGVRATDAPAALVSHDVEQEAHGSRRGCNGCGYCHQGCRYGAKSGTDNTFLPLAVAHGAELRTECFAHGFERDAAGRITAVLFRHEGRERRQRCLAVFLCAGAVETPRLLLHAGLCDTAGHVGRHYMAHGATQVWGRFPREMRPNKGYPSALITEDMVRPADADFAGGYLVQSLGAVPQTWGELLARNGIWGDALHDMLDGYNHMAGIGINAECLPQDGNRLALSGETAEDGLPKVLIEFGGGPNEEAMRAHAVSLMRGVWEAAGATGITVLERTAHTIGTCRMAARGDDGVVDPHGRSFDVPNLWICDNSVFPSSLAANPALTIMALSLRTADAFLEA